MIRTRKHRAPARHEMSELSEADLDTARGGCLSCRLSALDTLKNPHSVVGGRVADGAFKG